MPSRFLQGEPLAKLIESEKVTVAGGVPTIWLDLLSYADENKPDLSSLRTVACGGSAVPLSLMQAFEERHGVHIIQAWGMTETSPLGIGRPAAEGRRARTRPGSATAKAGPAHAARRGPDRRTTTAPRSTGTASPPASSRSAARGSRAPTTTTRPATTSSTTAGCAPATSPRSTSSGYIRITDRAKDVIKSGGEWISSVELEVELMAHDGVVEAAVIAKPDERWQERPLACVVRKEGKDVSAEDLCEHLTERVAKWWIPDEFAFIDEVPKTSVGKFDKKVLRKQLADGELEGRESVERKAPALSACFRTGA